MLKGLATAGEWNAFGLEAGLDRFDEAGQLLKPPGRPPRTTFNVEDLRIARRQVEGGDVLHQMVAVVRQRRPEQLGENRPGEWFWFRGGARLIIDLESLNGKVTPSLRYVIRKPMVSTSRLERERDFRSGRLTTPLAADDAVHDADAEARHEEASLRATYFPLRSDSNRGRDGFAVREPFAMIHAERD